MDANHSSSFLISFQTVMKWPWPTLCICIDADFMLNVCVALFLWWCFGDQSLTLTSFYLDNGKTHTFYISQLCALSENVNDDYSGEAVRIKYEAKNKK